MKLRKSSRYNSVCAAAAAIILTPSSTCVPSPFPSTGEDEQDKGMEMENDFEGDMFDVPKVSDLSWVCRRFEGERYSRSQYAVLLIHSVSYGKTVFSVGETRDDSGKYVSFVRGREFRRLPPSRLSCAT